MSINIYYITLVCVHACTCNNINVNKIITSGLVLSKLTIKIS